MKTELFENELKVGDKIIYRTGDYERKGTIIKRTKRSITFKLIVSTVKLTFINGCPARDLGLRRVER